MSGDMSGDMTRSEIANLERLIRKQEKVLKATTEQRAAELRADFEAQMLARSSFDQEGVWKEADALAKEVTEHAQEQVAKLIAGDEALRDPTPTAEKILGAYLAHKSPEKSAAEQKADRRRARMWTAFLGRKFDLSRMTLQRWMQFIKARRSGAIDAEGQPRG